MKFPRLGYATPFAAMAIAISASAWAEDPPKPAEAPKPPVSSAEYQKGWCMGYFTAQQTTLKNYAEWMSTLRAAAGDDAKPNASATIASSVGKYVLISGDMGKFQLGNGALIDCTPVAAEVKTEGGAAGKPPAVGEPPK